MRIWTKFYTAQVSSEKKNIWEKYDGKKNRVLKCTK